jgi:hypothetical protein
MKTTLSPRTARRQVPMRQTTLQEVAMKTARRKDCRIAIPDLSKSIQQNPSLICLENILRLPKINKEYKVDIVDDHFTIRYFENKKRVELTYRQKDQDDKNKKRVELTYRQKDQDEGKELAAGYNPVSKI